MLVKDDRTDTQQDTLSVLIGGKDTCMSGWGEAEGGISYAFWACTEEDAAQVEEWVGSRSDIECGPRVEPKSIEWFKANPEDDKNDHCHIYCVTPGHPALAK